MSRPHMARKVPTIDMTAMCDVAFLLLSFFILATKLKPSEAVPVETPSSVSAIAAPTKDVVLVTLNKEGKVFLSMQDEEQKKAVLAQINDNNKLGLSPAEIDKLSKQSIWGVPFAQLKQQAAMSEKQLTEKLPGIPSLDSAANGGAGKNELAVWMASISDVYLGKNMNLLLKGDNVAKYPAFKGIITAFTSNEQFKFSMVTNPEAIPAGTLLWDDARAKSGMGK